MTRRALLALVLMVCAAVSLRASPVFANDLAPAAGAATAAPAPTATPTPRPACTPAPARGGVTFDVTVCLKYRTAPDLSSADKGAFRPNPSGFPIPISGLPDVAFDANPKKNSDAGGLVFAIRIPKPSSDDKSYRLVNGIPFVNSSTSFESRVALIIERESATKTTVPAPASPGPTPVRLVVEINDYGACVQTARRLTDDLFAACKVEKFDPTAEDDTKDSGTGGGSGKKPQADASAAPELSTAPEASAAPENTWTAWLTIPWSTLNELFLRPPPAPAPGGRTATFKVCYAALHVAPKVPGISDPDKALNTYYGEASDPIKPCATVNVAFRADTKGTYDAKLGSKSGSATSDSSSGSTLPSSLRRALAAQPATAATPKASPQAAPQYTGTFAQPVTPFLQVSGEGNYQNAQLPSFSKQTHATLGDVIAQQAAQQFGKALAGGLGTATSTSAFNSVDVDVLQRLMPSAFRGYSDPTSTLTNPPQAFDGTDVLDLLPFNVSTVATVTTGAKVVSVAPLFGALGPYQGVAGLSWFHDSTHGESGSIFHLDQEVNSNLSFGISQVVGNTVTPPTNAYVDYPNPRDVAYPLQAPADPVLHSTNTVAGALLKFGNGFSEEAQPFEAFFRYGTNGYGRDEMAALSGSNVGSGWVTRENGTTFSLSGLAGYRSISYDYDPLLTAYDPLAGNQIYFGRGTIAWSVPNNQAVATTNSPAIDIEDRSGTLPYTVTVAGVYANAGGIRNYGSFGISPSIPLNAKPPPNAFVTYALTGTFERSYISATVLSRESGSFVYVDPLHRLNLLDNDASTLSLQAQSTDALLKRTKWSFSLTAGAAFTHSPNCKNPSVVLIAPCTSPFAHKVTWTFNAGTDRLVAYTNAQPGSTRADPTSVSSSIPSNSIVATALVAYHICTANSPHPDTAWGAEPSLTYKNNIAQDGSSFQPGTLLEAGIDFGPQEGFNFGVLGKYVVSLNYQNAVTTNGTPVQLTNHGFGFNFITASQAIWQLHKAKNDPCLSKK